MTASPEESKKQPVKDDQAKIVVLAAFMPQFCHLL